MESNLKKSALIGVAALAVAFVVFGFLGLLDRGYRLSGVRVVAPGDVALAHVPEGGKLRIGEREVPQEPQEGVVSLSLPGGTLQTIIISREGFWPWEKEVVVPSGQTLAFNVFLMPVSPVGTPILEKPERRELEAAFARTKLPSRASPALSADGSLALFAEDGRIIVTRRGEEEPPQYLCVNDPSCSEHAALSFDAELRDLAFYPGRSDIALLAIQNGIFALELDNRGTQNFQPVYRGTRPRLLIKDGEAYLFEGQAVLRLSL